MRPEDACRVFRIGGGESEADLTAAQVGAKAANLARLDRMGLRVPPALALTTALFRHYREQGGRLPDGFAARLSASLRWLEDTTGLTLGGDPPLLLAIRPSPVSAMAGGLTTLLNVGLTEKTARALTRRTGNPSLAWDAYRRLACGFGESVHHLAPTAFEALTATHLARVGATSCQELDPIAMRELAIESASLLRALAREPLPQDPIEQLGCALDAVLASWNSSRARECRRANGVDEEAGPALMVQAMVFGNAGARSGTGIGFTRNPGSGDRELYFDFVFNAQGSDLASGDELVYDSRLPRVLPDVWTELQTMRSALEYEFRDMQEFEFTVEEGRLYFLHTRHGDRTPWAAARIATDLVSTGIIDADTALQRLAPYDLDSIGRQSLLLTPAEQPLARAAGGSLGVATGAVAFDASRAQQLAAHGPVILLRPHLSTDDLAGIAASAGIVTTFGGRTSHTTVLARQLGRVALVGCADLHVDHMARGCHLGAQHLREGDVITIDGATGHIYAGRIDAVAERPREVLAVIDSWRGARARVPDSLPPSAIPPPRDIGVSVAALQCQDGR
jgi:pyruvate,orthophosphate dikinase